MGCARCSSSSTARDNAAVCASCPEAEREGWNPVVCTVNGRDVKDNCLRGECPIGAFTDARGVSVQHGVRWYGPSIVGRLILWAVHPKHPRPSSFSGCGCVVTLKALWSTAMQRR